MRIGHNGSMTANQFRAAIKSLGLTQAGAAAFLGVSLRTAWGYCNGEHVPVGHARLLNLTIWAGVDPAQIDKLP